MRKPIFLLWLKECRAAIIALVAHALFMTLLLGPLVRLVVPEKERTLGDEIAGIFGRKDSTRHERVLGWLDPIFWFAGWSLVGALAKARVRPAIAEARRRSDALAADAQKAAQAGELVKSVILLQRAEALQPAQEHRAALSARWHQQEAAITNSARSADLAPTSIAPPAALSSLGPGGRIKLVRLLGRGAMGVVHLGEDSLLGRKVAVKELTGASAAEAEVRDRFLREARVLAQISNPNVVQVYDLYQEAGRSFLCMELCQGPDLAKALRERGKFEAREAARIGAQIAEALDAAHQKGVVHRDLKPGNVLFAGERAIKVADFGLARLGDSHLTQEGTVMGTPYYMAPEQALGRPVDGRADLYALGCVLFELVTGAPPYTGTVTEVLAQHASPAAPPDVAERAPGAPAELCAMVARLLAKDPAARPQNAREVSDALAAIGAGARAAVAG